MPEVTGSESRSPRPAFVSSTGDQMLAPCALMIRRATARLNPQPPRHSSNVVRADASAFDSAGIRVSSPIAIQDTSRPSNPRTCSCSSSRSLETSSRRNAVRTDVSAVLRRVASPCTLAAPLPVCSSTLTSRSGRGGSASTDCVSTSRIFSSFRLKVAVPASRADNSLTSVRSADRRVHDFSASTSIRRCWSVTGPARSVSSILR